MVLQICRLVLNVQSLHVQDETGSEAEPNGVELTSAFSIDEMGTISKGASLGIMGKGKTPASEVMESSSQPHVGRSPQLDIPIAQFRARTYGTSVGITFMGLSFLIKAT